MIHIHEIKKKKRKVVINGKYFSYTTGNDNKSSDMIHNKKSDRLTIKICNNNLDFTLKFLDHQ